MTSDVYIQCYGNHVEVYRDGDALNRKEALELLNEILESETDDEGIVILSNMIKFLELEERRLS